MWRVLVPVWLMLRWVASIRPGMTWARLAWVGTLFGRIVVLRLECSQQQVLLRLGLLRLQCQGRGQGMRRVSGRGRVQ